jgi:hypothetical protein
MRTRRESNSVSCVRSGVHKNHKASPTLAERYYAFSCPEVNRLEAGESFRTVIRRYEAGR